MPNLSKVSTEVVLADFTQSGWDTKSTKLSATAIVHEKFTGDMEIGEMANGYDIALLRLNRSVGRKDVLKICQKSYIDSELAACGMGMTVYDDPTSNPDVLQEVQLKELKKGNCDPVLEFFDAWSPSTQICTASVRPGKGVCMGDSGGALFPLSGDTAQCLYGITSFVARGCQKQAVFTRVSAFSEWISSKIALHF